MTYGPVIKVVSRGVNYGAYVSPTHVIRRATDPDVQRRLENVARDFHVDLAALTDRQFLALVHECGG